MARLKLVAARQLLQPVLGHPQPTGLTTLHCQTSVAQRSALHDQFHFTAALRPETRPAENN